MPKPINSIDDLRQVVTSKLQGFLRDAEGQPLKDLYEKLAGKDCSWLVNEQTEFAAENDFFAAIVCQELVNAEPNEVEREYCTGCENILDDHDPPGTLCKSCANQKED